MKQKLSYEEWREDIRFLFNAVKVHGSKSHLSRVEVLLKRKKRTPAEIKKFVAEAEAILEELDYEGRDMFFKVYRNRKHMEDKTQVRVYINTREQLRKLMADYDWKDYDEVIAELIAFWRRQGG
ncbi:MAG: hypothetical protein CL577_09280 [Alteromonadaceae bacterium]|jgi:hypothetical protein|uniref:Uncharacterized protein n=1 Tax=Rheinheimera aquimaris TaxID=412437 RepID=A0ABP3P919_9GAMM|nr:MULTISPECIES: hypothetical protein [Rheinheimera]MBJ92770.1 hypothetical protein [Alteromonadaceae bacterium]MCB5214319.1 hypothetical protein [Rheinheimera aquimaris]MCD1600220.1 hypothetical protein [Rheinheimera aquimaris]|tara:strand:- start:3357 stop:3728 length:372 start_codon:yes stop_codon:yes gene_type:complete